MLTTGDYEAWRRAYPEAYANYLALHNGKVITRGDDSSSANGPHWDALWQR